MYDTNTTEKKLTGVCEVTKVSRRLRSDHKLASGLRSDPN